MTVPTLSGSELRDELPRFWGIPAGSLTRILWLPSVRAVEDAIDGWVTCGAVLVDRAGVRLASGGEVQGIGFSCAAVDCCELRLFHFPTRRRGRTGAVLARLRRVVGDGLRQRRWTGAGKICPGEEGHPAKHVRTRTSEGDGHGPAKAESSREDSGFIDAEIAFELGENCVSEVHVGFAPRASAVRGVGCDKNSALAGIQGRHRKIVPGRNRLS